MKSILVALAVAASLFVVVPAAEAGPACATTAEYRKVAKGQTLRKVRAIFGGKELTTYDVFGTKQRSWHKCKAGEKYAQVDFKAGRVVAKRWTT